MSAKLGTPGLQAEEHVRVDQDPRRLFTSAQRMEIYIRSQGKCSRCSMDLDRETFHAHHKVPHASGGRTHVDNGVALCVECHKFVHRDEVDQNSVFNNFRKTYAWQEQAITRFFDGAHTYYAGNKGGILQAFVVEVSPSGGKTIFSMKLAKEMICRNMIDRVVWVVPRDSIKNGFEDDVKRVGELPEDKRLPGGGKHLALDLSITSNYAGRLRNMHGVVITYSALNGRMIEWLRLLAASYRLLFVFDEAHHGAEDQDAAGNEWGRGMLSVQEIACSIVAMTGTPVRADGRLIPFLTYENSTAVDIRGKERPVKVIKPSFKFGYRDAVSAGVARRMLCINVDPVIDYSLEFEGQVEMLSGRLSAVPIAHLHRVKHVATDFSAGIVDEMLQRVDDELNRMLRNGDSDAACLIVCRRGGGESNALPKVAARIKSLFGERAVTVESADGERARHEIRSFKRDTSRWIVAKDMISEGTNIPRVRIVCILRDVGNQTYYEQLVHRSTRNDADDRPEDAIVVQLSLPNLVQWGAQLENNSRLIWDDPPKEPGVLPTGDGDGDERPLIEGISASLDDDVDQVIIAGADFTDTDPVAKDLFDVVSQFAISRAQINMVLRAQKDRGVDISGHEPAQDVRRGLTDQELMTYYRDQTGILIKRAARHGDPSGMPDRIKKGWGAVRRMANVQMKLDDIPRDHPRPLDAMRALHDAADRHYRSVAGRKTNAEC